ncbi:MAG TPA: type II secretion system protein [Desulfosarcina sp.]|nr:type II secretion system protein [Desulfosarcina sp.]
MPSSSAQPPIRRRSGFTLLEIMLVVGIMGIILAMGLPAIVRTIERDPLHQAMKDVEEALSRARALAILQGTGAEMILDGEGRVRAVPRPSPAASVSEPAADPFEERSEGSPAGGLDAQFEAVLGQDVGITSVSLNLRKLPLEYGLGEVRVRFHANGTSDDFSVVLEDATGAVEIVLDPVTALPTVVVLR